MIRRFLTIASLVGLLFFPGDRLLLPIMSAAAQGVNNLQYIKVVSASITPAATSAAVQTTEQTFNTYLGLAVGDQVVVIGPQPTSLCPPVTYRVSAANTLAIGFATLTAAACTPAAGVYTAYAFRGT